MRTLRNSYRDSNMIHLLSMRSGILELTESDAIEGTVTWDSAMLEGQALQFGTAIADEMKISLDNSAGVYSENMVGVEFDVQISSASIAAPVDREAFDWDQMGMYIVTQVDTAFDGRASFTLHDRMVLLDDLLPADIDLTGYSLYDLLSRFLASKNIAILPLADEISFLSGLFITNTEPLTGITIRDFVRFCAGLMWKSARMDPYGNLIFKGVTPTQIKTYPQTRFSSQLQEMVTVQEIHLVDAEGAVVQSFGTESDTPMILSAADNPLIEAIGANVLKSYYEGHQAPGHDILGFYYYPMMLTCFPYYEAEPGDRIWYLTSDGTELQTLVTSIGHVLNGSTGITSSAESKRQQLQYIGSVNEQNRNRILKNQKAIEDVQKTVAGINPNISLLDSAFIGTVAVNDGILQANGKDLEIRIGG